MLAKTKYLWGVLESQLCIFQAFLPLCFVLLLHFSGSLFLVVIVFKKIVRYDSQVSPGKHFTPYQRHSSFASFITHDSSQSHPSLIFINSWSKWDGLIDSTVMEWNSDLNFAPPALAKSWKREQKGTTSSASTLPATPSFATVIKSLNFPVPQFSTPKMEEVMLPFSHSLSYPFT